MSKLEKYLNNCYLEGDKHYIFVYKLVKVNNRYGLLCNELQNKPCCIYVYEDFPEENETIDNMDFCEAFIPELNPECDAKQISAELYYKLSTHIQHLYDLQMSLNNQIKSFIEENGLGEKV